MHVGSGGNVVQSKQKYVDEDDIELQHKIAEGRERKIQEYAERLICGQYRQLHSLIDEGTQNIKVINYEM